MDREEILPIYFVDGANELSDCSRNDAIKRDFILFCSDFCSMLFIYTI